MRASKLRSAGAAALCVLASGLVFASAPSFAFEGYGVAHQFGQAGSGEGQLSDPGWVAVEESSGDVYVVDSGNNRIEKFDAEGKYLSKLEGGETPAHAFSSPWEIAVDNTADAAKGDVYVGDVGNNAVDIFDAGGKYVSQITGTPSGTFSNLEGVAIGTGGQLWIYDGEHLDQFSDTGAFVSEFSTGHGSERGLAVDSVNDVYLLYGIGQVVKYNEAGTPLSEQIGEGFTALAIDPTTDELFADGSTKIEKFGPFGEPFGEPFATFGESALGGSHGVAVNGATGLVYAASDAADKVYGFKYGVFADVTTGTASEVQQTTATVQGIVNPDGKPTTYHFEYGTTTTYGTSTPTMSAGEESAEVPVSAGVTGLEFGTTYHYRLVAENENGTNFGADAEFTTAPAAPTIDLPGSATNITRNGVKLSATIDPGRGETKSYFEYGPTVAYGLTSYETTSPGTGEAGVSATVTELLPQTTYHFRVVATNKTATVRGPDQTFISGPSTPPLAITAGARDLSQSTATITGTVNDNGLPGAYAFRIATTPEDLGPPTGFGAVAFGAGAQSVALELTGLQPGTTYYYRVRATNVDGTVEGSTLSFTTAFEGTHIAPPASLPLLSIPAIVFPGESVTKPKPKSKPKQKLKPTKHRHKKAKRRSTKGKKKAKTKG